MGRLFEILSPSLSFLFLRVIVGVDFYSMQNTWGRLSTEDLAVALQLNSLTGSSRFSSGWRPDASGVFWIGIGCSVRCGSGTGGKTREELETIRVRPVEKPLLAGSMRRAGFCRGREPVPGVRVSSIHHHIGRR